MRGRMTPQSKFFSIRYNVTKIIFGIRIIITIIKDINSGSIEIIFPRILPLVFDPERVAFE